MSSQKDRKLLLKYEQEYRNLTRQLADIGPVKKGSLGKYYNQCLSGGRRCQRGGQYRHGPYSRWSTKVNGKNVSRRLQKDEFKIYQQFIDNNKKLKEIIAQLYHVSEKMLQEQLRLLEKK